MNPASDIDTLSPRIIEAVRRAQEQDESSPATFAARHLGVPSSLVFSASLPLDGYTHTLAGRVLAAELERVDGWVPGPGDGPEPTWHLLELRDGNELIPASASIALPPGALAPFPMVLRITMQWPSRLEVLTALEHAWTAQQVVTDLVRRSRLETNPFRGQVVRAQYESSLELHLAPTPAGSRDDVLLPEGTWRTIEQNVHQVVARADELIGVGLGASRGLLLHGPPGTGKTAISRVVATELAGRATIILCTPDAATCAIDELYRAAVDLAPAVVIIEDLDLIVGDRRRFGANGLQQFLVALDGVASTGSCIITLASTNDLEAIDEAARRTARFDVVLEIPRPDRDARAQILSVYLRRLDHDVDCDRVAAATSGASASDLRELVRRAVIEAEGRPSTAGLLALSRVRRGRSAHEGLYL
jgi:hypothetical protein